MIKEDRFYAFIVDHTSKSRARIHRIQIDRRWAKVCVTLGCMVLCAASYGLYGLTQAGSHTRIARENERLRAENERQHEQLNNLNNRVEAVEDASRRLAEITGVPAADPTSGHGAGGPALPLDASALEYKTGLVEQQLRKYETTLRERSVTPAGWPVDGNFTDGYGGRRNPFGGPSSEFHGGQDIATASGTPVKVTANGEVIFAGWQNGYGQVVVVDHGGGLTTRYGHLSDLQVAVGQRVRRAEVLGHVGSTGRSTGPHVHYEIRMNDEPIDPSPYSMGN